MPATTESTIAERMERVSPGRFHRRFIALVSLGNFFDLYDIFIVAYLVAALQQSGFLTRRQFTGVVAAGFLGMFGGTAVFGLGSDRMGRRRAFILLLFLYSVFTFAGAFAPNAAWLIALRFLAGVGIGAEIVVIDTYVTEMVPSAARGRYVAITQVVGFCAVPVAAVLSRALVPTHWLMSGWRWVMMIGAAGALLTWWFRRRLPESPRWLASRGRIAEAEAVVEALEEENLSSNSRDKRPHQERAGTASAGEKRPHEAAKKAAFGELWRAPFLRQQGVSLLRSLEYTMLIAAVSPAGPLLAAWTSDKLERKWTIIVLALSVAALGLGFGNSSAPGAVVGFGALLTLANYWFSAAFHAYQAELFPTRLRGTGVGFTYSWSRLSAAFTSVLVGWVLGFGVPAVFALLAAAMGLVAL